MRRATMNLTHHKPGHVYCVDASQWDFSQRHVKIGVPANNSLLEDDRTDVLLEKKGVDFDHLYDTSLVTVGGYIHSTDTNGQGLYIRDGYTTQLNLETNHVGIINFEEVGGIVKQVPLSGKNVFASDVKEEWWRSVFVHVPEVNFKHHLVGLVICGELYWLGFNEKIIKFINHNTLKLDFIRWHLFSKIYHLKSVLTTNQMGLTPYIDNRIAIAEVKQESFIRSLFDLSQTFLVIVESDKELVLDKKLVHGHQLPKRYFTPNHHYQPLRASDGRYLPYFIYDDRNMHCIVTEENRWYPQQNDMTIRADQEYLNELAVSSRRGSIRTAHFINIKTKE